MIHLVSSAYSNLYNMFQVSSFPFQWGQATPASIRWPSLQTQNMDIPSNPTSHLADSWQALVQLSSGLVPELVGPPSLLSQGTPTSTTVSWHVQRTMLPRLWHSVPTPHPWFSQPSITNLGWHLYQTPPLPSNCWQISSSLQTSSKAKQILAAQEGWSSHFNRAETVPIKAKEKVTRARASMVVVSESVE